MKSTFHVGLLTTLGIATERTAVDRRRLIALEAPSVFFLPPTSGDFFLVPRVRQNFKLAAYTGRDFLFFFMRLSWFVSTG
jgi:hypothetical protein